MLVRYPAGALAMGKTLDRLEAFVAAHPKRAFFEPAADENAIATVEQAIGLKLPPSYRAFLRRFNGGFINICAFGPDDEYWNVKTARWNSNWLFGTADLIKQYDRARTIGGWDRIVYIPFCQTNGKESLVFVPRPDGSEPPVLDAFHEASEWAELYPDFPSMLLAYVEREGNIETIAPADRARTR
jgi:hypothetical protein